MGKKSKKGPTEVPAVSEVTEEATEVSEMEIIEGGDEEMSVYDDDKMSDVDEEEETDETRSPPSFQPPPSPSNAESIPPHTHPTVSGETFSESVDRDPYLLKEAHYLRNDTKWKNKQRTLILCSRGISHRYRHLMDDIKRLLPHHKAESKIDKKLPLSEVVSMAVDRSCNNIVYFESRKGNRVLYLWMVRAPKGPSVKFQVRNVHTSGELQMTGNFLLNSRPLLSFDKIFDDLPHLRLVKEVFIQSWGTPRNHPKSKPFFDHVMSFMFFDGNIWVRHYQIHPIAKEDFGSHERIAMTEIGPRMALQVIRVFRGVFGGGSLYLNSKYLSPTRTRVLSKQSIKNSSMARLRGKVAKEQQYHENWVEESEFSVRNLFGRRQESETGVVLEKEGDGKEDE
eukprot:GHVN01015651.1.p1 GENE.GHVN01015651.1~~GHVN01015651.1.p1  ORF type:complete len:396 (-),score=112.60 GHVN01015651.1:688-1875(-)